MASRFDFELDGATLAAVQKMASQVTVVSVERIAQEMVAMLILPARPGCGVAARSGILPVILPEVAALAIVREPMPQRLNRGGTIRCDLGALAEPSFALALAALLQATDGEQSSQSAKTAEAIAGRRKLSNDEVDRSSGSCASARTAPRGESALAAHSAAADLARESRIAGLARSAGGGRRVANDGRGFLPRASWRGLRLS